MPVELIQFVDLPADERVIVGRSRDLFIAMRHESSTPADS
jgi:hypothetical protein